MPDSAAPTLSPLKAARRDKILDAAEALFSANGIRATSMEAVAEAVQMSKVTVYGYFRDKDTLFAAVADRLADRLLDAVLAGLASSGELADRLTAGLMAKHRIVHALVRSSAFSDELFAAKDRHAADTFRQLDDRICAELAGVMVGAGHARDDAEQLARILFAAADGLARFAADLSELESQITRVTRALLNS